MAFVYSFSERSASASSLLVKKHCWFSLSSSWLRLNAEVPIEYINSDRRECSNVSRRVGQVCSARYFSSKLKEARTTISMQLNVYVDLRKIVFCFMTHRLCNESPVRFTPKHLVYMWERVCVCVRLCVLSSHNAVCIVGIAFNGHAVSGKDVWYSYCGC